MIHSASLTVRPAVNSAYLILEKLTDVQTTRALCKYNDHHRPLLSVSLVDQQNKITAGQVDH